MVERLFQKDFDDKTDNQEGDGLIIDDDDQNSDKIE